VRPFVILLPALLVLAGCGGGYGGGSGNSSQGTVLRTIQISEKEYSLTPSTLSVSKPGTYAFKATNDGQTGHALEIEGSGIEAKTGEIQPGSSATLQITLSKAGSYEMYCPIDGHKQEGMEGDVTVGADGGSGGVTTNEGTTTTSGGGYGY
jgi:plastocyanin